MPYALMLTAGAAIMGTDIYIPGMPQMAQELGTTHALVQRTITAGVIGGSAAALIIGPLSDAQGRYKLLLFSQIFTTVAALLCGLSDAIGWSIFFRFLYGFGSAGGNVLTVTMLTEGFAKDRAEKYVGWLVSVIAFSLVAAPLLGGFLVENTSWRSCFFASAALNFLSSALIWGTVHETLKKPQAWNGRASLASYKKVLSDRVYLRLVCVPAALIGGLMLYFANTSFYFITQRGWTPQEFGQQQFMLMALFWATSVLAPRWSARRGLRCLFRGGIYLMNTGALTAIIGTFYNDTLVVIGFSLFIASLGLGFAAYTSAAVQRHPGDLGTASAASVLARFILIGIATATASLFYNGSLQPTMFVIGGIALFNTFLYLTTRRFITT